MEFPLVKFRQLCTRLEKAPDEMVLAWSEQADAYLDEICDKHFDRLWVLLTAHLLMLNLPESQGGVSGQSGQVQSASIDKVSVSYKTLDSTGEFSQWLNQTQFGQMFLVLLKKCTGGVRSTYQPSERSAFRIVGGEFPRSGFYR